MSAMGQKRTSELHRSYVRFAPESRHSPRRFPCLLSANSGHSSSGAMQLSRRSADLPWLRVQPVEQTNVTALNSAIDLLLAESSRFHRSVETHSAN